MITDEGNPVDLEGVVESGNDCLYISKKENQIMGVVL